MSGGAEYARKLAQVENPLWETASAWTSSPSGISGRLPAGSCVRWRKVLVRIAVTLDVLGDEASSRNGKGDELPQRQRLVAEALDTHHSPAATLAPQAKPENRKHSRSAATA